MKELTKKELERLKELHGESRVAIYFEVAKTIESGALIEPPTQEDIDQVAKIIMGRM